MGHLGDDLARHAAGQDVVDQPPHQRTLLGHDDPMPAQILAGDDSTVAERSRLRADDQDQRLILQMHHVHAGYPHRLPGARQPDLTAARYAPTPRRPPA